MRIFPIGREAPEGKINRAGRENCQSIVHGQRSENLTLHLKTLNCRDTIEVQVSEVTSIWFNVTVMSKKSWSVPTVFTMERIDIRYALAEEARDKRFVESLQ